jgi:hypothetical protein
MKERPIVCRDWEVWGILEGTWRLKRAIRRLPPTDQGFDVIRPGVIALDERQSSVIRCPHGEPGDRLWVRETWREISSSGSEKHGYVTQVEYRADGKATGRFTSRIISVPAMHYGGDISKDGSVKWRPSIFMPRWASRLTLEITEVGCERSGGLWMWDISFKVVQKFEAEGGGRR